MYVQIRLQRVHVCMHVALAFALHHIFSVNARQGYLELVQAFKNVYDAHLMEIAKQIDLEGLGVHIDVHEEQKHEKQSGREQERLRREIRSEWTLLFDAEEHQNIEFGFDCCLNSKCVASKRVQFVMDLYKQYFLNPFVYPLYDDQKDDDEDSNNEKKKDDAKVDRQDYADLFLSCLSKYEARDLLNDFEHIKAVHLQTAIDRKMYVNCEHHQFDTCCNALFELRINAGNARNEPDEKDEDEQDEESLVTFNEYLSGLDVHSLNLLHVTSKIHTLFNHSNYRQQIHHEE